MSFLQPELSFAPIAATTFSSSRVNTTTYSSITFTGQSNDNTTVTFNWYNDSISAAIGSDSYSIPNTSIAITYTFNIRTQYVSMTVTPTATITGTLQTLFNKALSIGNGPIGPTGPTGPAFGTQLYTTTIGNLSHNGLVYASITGGGDAKNSSGNKICLNTAGTFSDLSAYSFSLLPAGETRTHTLYVNSISTPLTTMLTDSIQLNKDVINTVTINPGDYVQIGIQTLPVGFGGSLGSTSIKFTP